MAAKTGTYTLIASNTLGTNNGTVTFNSIPATYTDLILIINAGATVAVDALMRFNNDSSTSYSYTILTANGTTASSIRRATPTQTGIYLNWSGSFDTTIKDTTLISINDYSNSTTYKTALIRNNNTGGIDAVVGLWPSVSTINRIDIVNVGSAGVFLSGSTFKLYGIEAGNQ